MVLEDKFKENWYALLIAILSEERLTVEEALAKMNIKIKPKYAGPFRYINLRKNGYSWEKISYITGTRNPRSIVCRYNKNKNPEKIF